MVKKYGIRKFRVLGLLLSLTINVVSSEKFVSNATTELGTKVEARSREEASSLGVRQPSRGKDSYLEALRHSHISTDPREGVVPGNSGSFQRREERPQGPVYVGSSHLGTDRNPFSMVPSDSYTLPTRSSVDFGAPAPGSRISYGPPLHHSQPPRPSYGPAFNDYPSSEEYHAPSSSVQQGERRAYGPSTSAYVPYGHGFESVQLGLPSIGFSWPFALKLNAFTLAKILLKLVIFKMIVKFIAVICLLLFIPKLEIKTNTGSMSNNANDEDDEGRSLLDANANSKVWNRLNRLTLEVHEALRQGGVDCSTIECRVQRSFRTNQSWPDYEQLLQSYILEETRLLRINS